MFMLFLLFWIILNGRLTAEILIIGILLSLAVFFFFCRFLGWSLKKDLRLLRSIPFLILYILNLVREVLIVAFQVARLVWSPSRKKEPVMVEFHSGLHGRIVNTLLANSITLTPGTFTVVHEDDRFVVHCIRPEFAEGLEDSSFIRLLRRVRT